MASHAAQTLLETGTAVDDAKTALTKLLDHRNLNIPRHAAEVLVEAGIVASDPAVRNRLLEDTDPKIAQIAVQALIDAELLVNDPATHRRLLERGDPTIVILVAHALLEADVEVDTAIAALVNQLDDGRTMNSSVFPYTRRMCCLQTERR